MPTLRKLLLALVLPALIWLFYNQTANWHYTRLANGALIEHAHPYDKHGNSNLPGPNHPHSESELLFLNLITHIIVLIIIPLALGKLIRKYTISPIPLRPRNTFPPAKLLVKDSRAPPSDAVYLFAQ
jgi:hypothetical protein